MLVRELSYRLPDGSLILDSLNVDIDSGEAIFIFGLNGSGKSTFAFALSGILLRLRGGWLTGSILLGNKDVSDMSPHERVSSIGLLLQNPDLQVFSTTLRDEISFVLENLAWDRRRIDDRVDELLDSVGLHPMSEHSPDQLSQGQKQLLSLCVAVAAHPSLIVLDEPDAFLDPVSERKMWQLVETEKKRGASVVILSSWPEPPSIADRVFTLENGRLKPGLPEKPEDIRIQVKNRNGEDIIFVESLEIRKNGRLVLGIPELVIGDGLTRVAGNTGSGKTTFTRLLVGLERPDTGQITLMGKKLDTMGLSEIGRIVGYLFQSPERQVIERTVEDEIAFSLKIREKYSEQKLEEVLELFDLKSLRSRFPLNLSGGELKRVALASLFALEPDYIVMDEPEANLDPMQLRKLAGALQKAMTAGSKGALITSPNKSHIHFEGHYVEISLSNYT